MFSEFRSESVKTGDARINLKVGGNGPPLLLLHGYPATHVCWHETAPRLAERFTVVATDLRGYGDSVGPEPDPTGANYTFREMAHDQVEVMRALGFDSFLLAGHDRGARTAHRLTLDHPDAVRRVALLDIFPTHYMWTKGPADLFRRAWHWVLCAQPYDLAEQLLTGAPRQWLLDKLLHGAPSEGVISPAAYAEYLRCLTPSMIRASCADYRSFATLDVELDQADLAAGRRIACPTLVLWGNHYDHHPILEIWREYAPNAQGQVVGAGHYLPEEVPGELADALIDFFTAPT
jgi:haloacetate dehalogenase